MFYVTFKL